MARRARPQVSGHVTDVDVAEEMRGSFLEYAYSVIYSRALPDARDGLKPVQRRILFQMSAMGLRPDRGHVKSARVVGEVMGRLHPHGDSAIYDALVRMAQPFSLRVPMIDGHGNFGSLDDGPAAMRYTEARLAPPALALTDGLDEDVVDFIPNYDGREREPIVLPAAFPSLIVNGASGIAVGMATSLVPHNLGEAIAAARALLANPALSLEQLMTYIPGPDFPGGGVVMGRSGIVDAYATGRGSFKVRARTRIEQVTPRRRGIVVTELPPSVGPERVIERLKELVQAKKITGISDVVDLTDGETGLHLVIECKAGFSPEAVLDDLFRLTPLEDNVTINAVALVDGQPQTLPLLSLVQVFLDHRMSVVTRRTEYRRARAADRLHLVEGLLVAIIDIDEVIAVIRDSDDAATARGRLISIFDLSELQANYILDMPLRRLTKFSRIELDTEADTLRSTIADLTAILDDPDRLRSEVDTELANVAQSFATPRRTLLLDAPAATASQPIDREIADEPCVVVVSTTGLVARVSDLKPGAGASARGQHDVVLGAAPTTTRGDVALITSHGRAHRLSALELPALPTVEGSPSLAGGVPLSAFVTLERDEKVVGVISPAEGSVLFTARGVVKRLSADAPAQRSSWDVISLTDNDSVVAAQTLSDGQAEHSHLAFVTSDAQLLYFPASVVRPQGRSAGGIAGIKCAPQATVVWGGSVADIAHALVGTVASSLGALPGTDAGSVKVTPLEAFPQKGRATGGVRCMRFRSGEDVITTACVGQAPLYACTASGSPVDLPETDSRRDATGSPANASISALGSLP